MHTVGSHPHARAHTNRSVYYLCEMEPGAGLYTQVDELRGAAAKLRKATKHRNMNTSAKCVAAWRQCTATETRQRGLIRRLVLRMRNQALVPAWQRWRQHAAGVAQLEAKTRALMQRLAQDAVASTFARWSASSCASRRVSLYVGLFTRSWPLFLSVSACPSRGVFTRMLASKLKGCLLPAALSIQWFAPWRAVCFRCTASGT